MRKLLLACAATAAAAASLTFAVPAEARDGCGRNAHRNYNGRCVSDRRYHNDRGNHYGRGYRGQTLVIGNFYQGRGYWDGRRYFQQRYRHNNGWRYR
ncbi:MAG: hypothetical protein V4659_04285 [Pseudomonadota bacterium]